MTILGLGYLLMRHVKVLLFGLLPGRRNILLETYSISKNDVVEKKGCFTLIFPYFPGANLGQMPAAAALRLRLEIPAADRGTI